MAIAQTRSPDQPLREGVVLKPWAREFKLNKLIKQLYSEVSYSAIINGVSIVS